MKALMCCVFSTPTSSRLRLAIGYISTRVIINSVRVKTLHRENLLADIVEVFAYYINFEKNQPKNVLNKKILADLQRICNVLYI